MQFRASGRLRVIRRMEGVGKVILESARGGGGVVNVEECAMLSECNRNWDLGETRLWKRTGQDVRESL
jgi:hypothetical protein